MRINTNNLIFPDQSSYDFCDGQLHNDPSALTNYLASQSRKTAPARNDSYSRSYEKAKRLARMAQRARKDRNRRHDD